MVAKARSVRLLAVLAVLGVATAARAQGPFPPPPPAPVPVVPGAEGAGPGNMGAVLGPPVPVTAPAPTGPPPAPPSGLSYVPPPPPAPPPCPPPGPAPAGPLFGPPVFDPMVFFNVDLDILKPVLTNRVTTTVPLPGGTAETVHVPTAHLDWTVSPKFELGYRLPGTLGLFAVSYRFLSSAGSTTLTDGQGNDFLVRTRADLNVIDFDYGTSPYAFLPRWELTTRLGFRLTDVFYDARLSNDFVRQQASNDLLGAGPHVDLDVRRNLALLPGVSLLGRVGGAVIIGQSRQRFHNGVVNADGSVSDSSIFLNKSEAAPVLSLEAGLSYSPTDLPYLRISAGYRFERYWKLGSPTVFPNGAEVQNHGELTTQGLFLRGEIDF